MPDDYWLSVIANLSCDGTRRSTSPCRRDFDTSPGFPDGRLTYNLPEEGTHTIRASVHQIAGGQYGDATHGQPWQVKIDRTAPTLGLSGSLYDRRNTAIGADRDVTLTVAATDGTLSSASAQRSGVKTLDVTLDGKPLPGGRVEQTCTRPEGSCPASATVTLTQAMLADLTPGRHSVEILATDQLGHSAQDKVAFDIDPIEPLLELDGSLASLEGEVLTEDSYDLRVEGLDRNDELFGTGIESIQVLLDGQPQPTTEVSCPDSQSCEAARLWQWDAAAATNGPRTIVAVVRDKAGNEAREEIAVDLQRRADETPRTLSSGLEIRGSQAGDAAGHALTVLDDINGDGRADYLVGAPGADPTADRLNGGIAYVVFGREEASVDLSAASFGGIRISGHTANAWCGTSVASVPDVNGDGRDDLLIGCPGADPKGPAVAARGRVYVVFGTETPRDVNLAALGADGFAIDGPAQTELPGVPGLLERPALFGDRLTGGPAGASQLTQDVNGDSLNDIVIGASAVARGDQQRAGAAYVIYGKTDNSTVDTTALASRGFAITGPGANALAGFSAAIIGDTDGDAFADIAVGAPGVDSNTGRAYVIRGNEQTDSIDLAAASSRVTTLTASAAQTRAGISVAAVGDTSRDGAADVAIGSASGAWIVRNLEPAGATKALADTGSRINGPVNAASLSASIPGVALSAAGDHDGDGRGDLTLGYPDSAEGPGRAYLVLAPEGNRTLDVRTLPGQRGAAIAAGTSTERSGAAVGGHEGGFTDTDQEIAASIAVGAPDANVDLKLAAGRVYVAAGQMAVPFPTSGLRAATASTTASPARKGCYNGRKTPYDFLVGRGVRFGYDVETFTDNMNQQFARYGKAEAKLPLCRITDKKKFDEVPRKFKKGGGRYTTLPLNGNPDQQSKRRWPIVDSFAKLYAEVEQEIEVLNGKRSVKLWRIYDLKGTVISEFKPSELDAASVQGYGCVVVGNRKDYAMFALRPKVERPGIRGFIARRAFKTAHITDAQLKGGDTGCPTSGLTKSIGAVAAPSTQSFVDAEHRYQGSTTARKACGGKLPGGYADPQCGVAFSGYEPRLDPKFAAFDVQFLTLSSTGVTGGGDGLRSGGTVFAVTRASREFKTLDRILYRDTNVPCGKQPQVQWVFGNANPTGRNKLIGWAPRLVGPVVEQPVRQCPAPAP